MSFNFNEAKDVSCDCCGAKIMNGDLIYDTGELMIHDECFYDYLRSYVLEIGWRKYIYGDEDFR